MEIDMGKLLSHVDQYREIFKKEGVYKARCAPEEGLMGVGRDLQHAYYLLDRIEGIIKSQHPEDQIIGEAFYFLGCVETILMCSGHIRLEDTYMWKYGLF